MRGWSSITIDVGGGSSSKDAPARGQFLSPDTLVPDAGLVLDYNRYMYVRGNPLKYTDPTGHFAEEDIPLICGGCLTWDDVLAYFGGSQEILTWLKNPLLTFGSLILGGSSTESTSSYGLLLIGTHDPLRMKDSFRMGVWDMNSNQEVALTDVFGAHTHLSAWSTNTEADLGGYFYTGLDRGFAQEDAVLAWAQPWQRGIADFHASPTGNWATYQLYVDWNGGMAFDWFFSLGKPSSLYDWASLTNDLADAATDIKDRVYWDNRYPTVYYGSPILGNRSLGLELSRPNPY